MQKRKPQRFDDTMPQTLVAIISTNRSEMEYLARNRQDIIDTFDALVLDVGDVIQLRMQFVDSVKSGLLREKVL